MRCSLSYRRGACNCACCMAGEMHGGRRATTERAGGYIYVGISECTYSGCTSGRIRDSGMARRPTRELCSACRPLVISGVALLLLLLLIAPHATAFASADPLWDVAIGRRPYISETVGSILLRSTDSSLGAGGAPL
eukprot:COSAG02_NODE_29704_length_564_cov_1.658065_1_plen_135_part_10